MKILVLNCGSSSVKYQLLTVSEVKPLAKGIVERIGMEGSALEHFSEKTGKLRLEQEIKDHTAAIELILNMLVDDENGVINNLREIDALGHRVAHGGSIFPAPVLIDSKVKDKISALIELAPLHNPPNLLGIEACQNLMPQTPQAAVFDTAFHQTMPEKAYTYGLPLELSDKYGIRRYGFHGTSHQYVAGRAAELIRRPLKDLKCVSCHLGNGASIAAIANGSSVDTSMGFTPLEGLIMGTRCGDLDPAIVTFLMEREGLGLDEINELLNKKSGVLGISGVSSDFRDLKKAAEDGDDRAELALEVFAYRVKKYIGAYAAVLNGLDLLVFTAGIGENSPEIRAAILSGMDFWGIQLDREANNVRGREQCISARESRCSIWVIPTNEEMMIAAETARLIC